MEEERICDYCGCVIEEEDEIYEGRMGFYCSDECRRRAEPGRICELCCGWDESTSYVGDDVGCQVCDSCYERRVETCYHCGFRFLGGDGIYGERGPYCCQECYELCEGVYDCFIQNYSYKPSPSFFETKEEYEQEEERYYFGVENEMNSEYAEEGLEDFRNYTDEFYFKKDGSLYEGGVEIVSHPMTLKYHAKEACWDEIFTIAKSNLEVDSCCGMHVHVGIKQFDNVVKTKANLVRFFDKFWDEIVKLSGRSNITNINEWAARPDVPLSTVTANEEEEQLSIIKKVKENGRYQAVNLQNVNTVEIRIFQGVDNKIDLLKNIALVNRIVEICDTMEWKDIRKIDFYNEVLLKSREMIENIEETKIA